MEYSHNTPQTFRPSVRDEKYNLRTMFKEKRREMSTEEKKELDSAICKKMLSLAAYRFADTVLSYMPLKYEVDITEFNLAVLKSGKRLALPKCIKGTPLMEFRCVKSLDGLAVGEWSAKEPSETDELWTDDGKATLCVIPGMAFDKEGYRLGYGKGYYDRFLPSKNLTRLGVVYSDFLVEKLPRGRFDLSMNMVMTEKTLISPSL